VMCPASCFLRCLLAVVPQQCALALRCCRAAGGSERMSSGVASSRHSGCRDQRDSQRLVSGEHRIHTHSIACLRLPAAAWLCHARRQHCAELPETVS
jgi:hypothetical protein